MMLPQKIIIYLSKREKKNELCQAIDLGSHKIGGRG